ncbi:MAG: aminoacyl-tRNA hydrolase [Candidatus Marinimicrobia bacterium]|nr:aminoacyl-tRNA hydrolase [Candidatus Neomarinimicrobiota bacterium]|tara:strand:- start:989 stop:1564 length:576 start_codon:yes stop_codon:yes gene_type:complete
MKAIAGLGNPGEKYNGTRHNLGFMVVDEFARRNASTFKAGKGDYVYSKINTGLILIKPTTYMNNSGFAIKSALDYFKIHISDIILIYDDIDLPLGTLRFKESGQSAGHRGVEDVIYHLSNHIFPRIKIGIANDGQMRPSEKFVLRKFRKNEHVTVKDIVDFSCNALDFFLINSMQETMNKFNKKSTIIRKD